jgi:hypothetical protein
VQQDKRYQCRRPSSSTKNPIQKILRQGVEIDRFAKTLETLAPIIRGQNARIKKISNRRKNNLERLLTATEILTGRLHEQYAAIERELKKIDRKNKR